MNVMNVNPVLMYTVKPVRFAIEFPPSSFRRYSCALRGCKNGPAPFPGRMSYKATKPGLVCVLYLSML